MNYRTACLLSLVALSNVVACAADVSEPKKTASAGDAGDAAVQGTSDGGSRRSMSASEAYCDKQCGFGERCARPGLSNAGDCRVECTKGGIEETLPKWRDGFASGVASCFERPACDQPTDSCLVAGLKAIEPNLETLPLVSECIAKRATCRADFDADTCATLVALKDEGRKVAQSCNAEPCSAFESCLSKAGAFKI